MESVNVAIALRDYPTSLCGYWTSADGAGCLDMAGATVAEAVAELLAQCSSEADRRDLLSGTIEIAC